MYKNYEVVVDTTQKSKHNSIVVNTNDLKTFKLSITINQSKKPIDLTGATVRLAIVKPDKTTVFQDCSLVDAANGKCEIILNSQAYLLNGVHVSEVMVYFDSETVAVTGRFSYSVMKGLLDGNTLESQNDWQAINKAIADAEGILIDLRENGTGVDAQARTDLETVNALLAQIAMNVKSFGAKGDGVTNDVEAIQNAINATPVGGVLLFPACDDFYLIDQNFGPVFVIDKPMTIKGERGSLIKIKDQSNLWHNGGRTQLFKVVKSNVVFDGVEIDGNSRNNFKIEGNKKIFYAVEGDNCYPTGVSLIDYIIDPTHPNGDSVLTGVLVQNSLFIDPSSGAVGVNGNIGMNDAPVTSNTSDNVVLYPIIRNNRVYKGQRSLLNFMHGVIGGVMEDNEGVDIYYYLCRQYLQCVDCVIRDNKISINTTLDSGATYESQTNGIPRTPVNSGVQAGHNSRGVGTVNNPTIDGNIIYANGNGEWRVTEAITVEAGVDKYSVKNNVVHGSTLKNPIAIHPYAKSGELINNSIMDILPNGIGISIRENQGKVLMKNNTMKSLNNSFYRGIELGVDSKNLFIEGNNISDNGGSTEPIWSHGSLLDSYLSQNYYNDKLVQFSDLKNAQSSNNVRVKNFEDYSLGQEKSSGKSYIAYRLGVPSSLTSGFYIVLERLSSSGGVGFTYGTIYGHRSDADAREFIVDINSHSRSGEHIARIEYVTGSRSVAKLIKLTYQGVEYLAVKIGDVTNDPRSFGVYFTGHHSSNGNSLFIVNSTETFTESPYTILPNGGWIYGGRPGDSIGNNTSLHIAGNAGTSIECVIDENGFIKVKP